MAFKCPECGADLNIRHLDGAAVVSCMACNMEKMVPSSGNDEEAYMNSIMQETHTTQNYDTMHKDYNIKQNKEQVANNKKIINVLTTDEVNKKIGDNDPPKLVREVLHSKKIRLAHYECLQRQDPSKGPNVNSMGIDKRIVKQLQHSGIETFYLYQAEAIKRIMDGESVVIEAPTAFGKTESFLVPIAHMCANRKQSGVYALFVYPTKALGRDQHKKIMRIAETAGVRAAVFDGDTPHEERKRLSQDPPDIIITNFDLLHYQLFQNGLLAHMLQGVKFFVVDETHTYTGFFGSNVHHIMARVRRFTDSLQYIGASATLNDSKEFCTKLFGQNVGIIRELGRKSTIDLVMLSPATVKTKNRERQLSKKELMVNLAGKLSLGEHKTMIFSNSHYNAERIGMEAKQKNLRAEIHRGGIEASTLNVVEKKFQTGEINIISCTPTLELGIDIGNVDTVISETIPSNRFMQRFGRAGREGNRGCAFLVLGEDPISQYYSAHPRDYMRDEWIPHIDVENPDVLERQTVAMASDRPLNAKEVSERAQIVNMCVKKGLLEHVGQTFKTTGKGRSLLTYSIRGIGESVTIHLKGKKVGDRNLPTALSELHPGAVYMLKGKRYLVGRLEYPTGKRAEIEPVQKGRKIETKALGDDSATVLEIIDDRKCYGMTVELCKLRITQVVREYFVIDVSREPSNVIARHTLDSPLSYSFDTKGIRFLLPRPASTSQKETRPKPLESWSYHAAEHVIIDGGRMVTGAAASDINGMSDSTGLVYVYDDTVGGNGISKVLYDKLEDAVSRARDVIAGCPCIYEEGCPRCTMSYRCKKNNSRMHKQGALESFRRIMDGEVTRV